MSEREELIDIIDPDAGRLCMAPHASAIHTADRILAAGYRRIPAEGTPEWEAMVERAAKAALGLVLEEGWWPPDEFDHEVLIRVLLRAALTQETDHE